MTVATLHADLRAAFREKLLGLEGLPAEYHWEGEAFTPRVGTPFLREKLVPVGSNPRGLGRGGAIAHRTLLLATLFYPSAAGTREIEAAAGILLEGFAPAAKLNYGAVTATILQVERDDLASEPHWVSCRVTITTLAYTAI